MSASGDAAVYLAVGDGAAALIDAGCGRASDGIIENIERRLPAQVTLDYLLLTHCHYDHAGGAADLRAHFGCAIAAHAQDAYFLERGDNEVTAAAWYGSSMEPFSIDIAFTEPRMHFQIGASRIEALHWPGHSPGSVVYVMESDDKKVLFGQDIHGPLHPSLLSNRDDYLVSLSMLQGLEADILCEGHFGVIQGREQVRRFIERFQR